MKITIPRDAVESLLVYAESEIEARCGCLKDAGPDRAELEAEISEANELFATVRESLKDQRHKPKTDIRHPMLDLGDKMVGLRSAILVEPVMQDDEVLDTWLAQLRESYDVLRRHLDAHYQWD